MKTLIIGCGGVAQHLLHSLIASSDITDTFIIYDGDHFDPHNIERQPWANSETIGAPKVNSAEVNLAKYGREVEYIHEFWDGDDHGVDRIICIADKANARKECLEVARLNEQIDLIIGANELGMSAAYRHADNYDLSEKWPGLFIQPPDEMPSCGQGPTQMASDNLLTAAAITMMCRNDFARYIEFSTIAKIHMPHD